MKLALATIVLALSVSVQSAEINPSQFSDYGLRLDGGRGFDTSISDLAIVIEDLSILGKVEKAEVSLSSKNEEYFSASIQVNWRSGEQEVPFSLDPAYFPNLTINLFFENGNKLQIINWQMLWELAE